MGWRQCTRVTIRQGPSAVMETHERRESCDNIEKLTLKTEEVLVRSYLLKHSDYLKMLFRPEEYVVCWHTAEINAKLGPFKPFFFHSNTKMMYLLKICLCNSCNIWFKSDACVCHFKITAINFENMPLVCLVCEGWASQLIKRLWLISVNLITVGVVSISPVVIHHFFLSLPQSLSFSLIH